MQSLIFGFGVAVLICGPVVAQERQRPSVTDQQKKAVSDEKAAEIRVLIAKARARQQAIDRQNERLWTRWSYAICIGCGPVSGKMRTVRTNPIRVLMGIPAAEDDARDQRGGRVV